MVDFVIIEGEHFVSLDSAAHPHGGERHRPEKCFMGFNEIKCILNENVTPGSETSRVRIKTTDVGMREWFIVGGTAGDVATRLGLI